ncbi:hypothetical protein F5141DRAFT_1108972 [Pisolithus sp. B1]|nr:hypothetical protein F5141DRAFT_1108972 [Pisolithus sp. B1]
MLGSLSCNYFKNILRQVSFHPTWSAIVTIILASSWCTTVSSLVCPSYFRFRKGHRLLRLEDDGKHIDKPPRCPTLHPKTLPWCIPLLLQHSTKLTEEYLFCITT